MNKATLRKIVYSFLFVVIMIATIPLVTSVYKIYTINLEKDVLQSKLELSKEKEEELQLTIKKLENPEYLSKFAREKLLYSKENEIIINQIQN